MSRSTLLKSYLPTLLVALALLGSTAAGVAYIHRLQSVTAAIVADNIVSLRSAEELEFALRDTRSVLLQYALTADNKLLERLPELDADFLRYLVDCRRSSLTEQERNDLNEMERDYLEYRRGIEELRRIENSAARSVAAERWADFLTKRVIPFCNAFLAHNKRSIEERAETHRMITVRLQYVLILAGLLIPLASVIVGYLASRRISQQLERSRERLRRSEQLAAVGQLAAGMAHELRNPLTTIMMMVQTSSESEPADLAVIEEEARRMERTIQACLDFAKPPQPLRCLFDVREAVAAACRLAEGRIHRAQAELVIDQSDCPLSIWADRQQMHQVLVNLLLNAAEGVSAGGRVGVVTRRVADTAEIRVWDNGAGIAPELLPQVFDPFFSTKPTGTGLGLSISQQIVEAHGGRIAARNRPEGGAEFIITLQCHGAPDDAHAAGRGRRAEHSTLLSPGVS